MTKVLFKVITIATFDQNVTNLAKGGKDKVTVKDLKATLAFLYNTAKEDKREAKLFKMGLCKMIIVRINHLEPEFSKLCMKDHYTMRGENLIISCLK